MVESACDTEGTCDHRRWFTHLARDGAKVGTLVFQQKVRGTRDSNVSCPGPQRQAPRGWGWGPCCHTQS